jgi:hypothetical protein
MRRTFRTAIVAIVLLLPILGSRAQQPPPAACAQVAPVCALKDGNKQSYWNQCLAARDGAAILYPGECRIARSPN